MPNFVYGIHSVESAIHAKKVDHLYVLKYRQTYKVNQLIEVAQKNKVPVTFVELGWLENKLGDVNHQGVAANLLPQSSQTINLEDFLKNNNNNLFFLILDEVQDPHNLGACFRIASAFNLSGIITPKNNSVGITPAVIKVASGAVDHVPFFQVTNLSRTLDLLKENTFFIYAADGYSDVSIYDEKFSGNVALVMGSEGKGIRRLTKDKCDLTFSIPMQGSIESLNVSVATGICVSEIRRKLG